MKKYEFMNVDDFEKRLYKELCGSILEKEISFLFIDNRKDGKLLENETEKDVINYVDDNILFWYGAKSVFLLDDWYILFAEYGDSSESQIVSSTELEDADDSYDFFVKKFESFTDIINETGNGILMEIDMR